MAELADARDSKSRGGNTMRVRPSLAAQIGAKTCGLFMYICSFQKKEGIWVMATCPYCGKEIDDKYLEDTVREAKEWSTVFVGTNAQCPHCQKILWLPKDGELKQLQIDFLATTTPTGVH